MEQHKQMIRDLMQGRLDLNNAPRESTYTPSYAPQPTPKAASAPVASPPKEEKPAVPASTPAPAPAPEAEKEKSLDDIILDFLAQEQKERGQKK